MKHITHFPFGGLLAGFVLLVSGNLALQGAASIIIDEQFANGVRDVQQKNPTTGTYDSLKWYSSTYTAFNALTVTTGSMTLTTKASNDSISARHAVAQFDAVSMAVGGTLNYSFDAVFTGIGGLNTSTSENAFHFGIFNSNGTTYTADNQNPYTTASGYDVRQAPLASVNDETKSRSYLGYRREVSPATAPLMTSVGPKVYPKSDYFGPLQNDAVYSYNLSMSLISDTEMVLLLTIMNASGTEILSETTTITGVNVVTQFDTLAFSAYNTTAGIGIDSVTLSNIKLTYSIPEASASTLFLGLAALALVVRRRR